MLRWRLILGLSATLLILLLVGTYGLYLFNALGKAVDSVLKDNYDSIKVCHFLRVTTARVNIFYTRGERPNPPYDQPEMLDRSERDVEEKLPVLLRNARDQASADLVRQLEATAAEYFASYRRVFAQYAAQDPTYHQTRGAIGELTLRITNLAETILQQNEHQMLLANQRVDKQAR
ncbi:MAG TPA: hypothetical protein VGD78_23760, partial [Chthoniobacterales bacterium]